MSFRTRITARSPLAIIAGAAALMLVLSGCASASEAPMPPAAEPSVASAEEMLAPLGLDGMDGREVIDSLEALPVAERPADLFASVRPDTLILTDQDGREASVPLPADQFYTSIAPYVSQTHDCYFHSLTTCLGELQNAELRVSVTDLATGETIIDETRTTNDNGFVGLWLPRDIDATITITHDGKAVTSTLSTNADAATCVTTLQLS